MSYVGDISADESQHDPEVKEMPEMRQIREMPEMGEMSDMREIPDQETHPHQESLLECGEEKQPFEVAVGEMEKFYTSIECAKENKQPFYDKLLALKQEHFQHMKLIESLYLQELNANTKGRSRVNRPSSAKPKSILKNTLSVDKENFNSNNTSTRCSPIPFDHEAEKQSAEHGLESSNDKSGKGKMLKRQPHLIRSMSSLMEENNKTGQCPFNFHAISKSPEADNQIVDPY
jgi:hypothetical protein